MADTPRLTVRCEYPNTDMPPTVVTFGLSPAYDIRNAHEANEWFLEMMRQPHRPRAQILTAQDERHPE